MSARIQIKHLHGSLCYVRTNSEQLRLAAGSDRENRSERAGGKRREKDCGKGLIALVARSGRPTLGWRAGAGSGSGRFTNMFQVAERASANNCEWRRSWQAASTR